MGELQENHLSADPTEVSLIANLLIVILDIIQSSGINPTWFAAGFEAEFDSNLINLFLMLESVNPTLSTMIVEDINPNIIPWLESIGLSPLIQGSFSGVLTS